MIDFDYYADPDYEVDINAYISSIVTVLKFWLDAHTKADVWAYVQLPDGDIEYAKRESDYHKLNFKIKTGQEFHFDIMASALEKTAERLIQEGWEQCNTCGLIVEPYQDCDCVYDEEEPDLQEVDPIDLMYWLRDIEAYDLVSEEDFWNTLTEIAFPKYREFVQDLTTEIEEIITEAIEDIENCNDPYELMAAVMQATQIYHVHGKVIEDYSHWVSLDFYFVDRVRNEGYEAVFGEDAVKEFVESYMVYA